MSLWTEWMKKDSNYSHGTLVPFISLFILWLSRDKLREALRRPLYWGLALILPSLLVHILAHWMRAFAISGLTLLLTLIGSVLVMYGPAVWRAAQAGVLYLGYALPLPQFLMLPLTLRIQLASTWLATKMVNLCGMEGRQEGTAIIAWDFSVLVGNECSGFRLLIAMLAFATLYVYLMDVAAWKRWLLVALVVPLSLLANSVRIFLIYLVGYQWGEDAMHVFHDYSGFLVMILTFVCLMGLGKAIGCRKLRFQL
ncbi:MAG: exosortase/archaeosortase family protein [Armatimonadetes bacterium]|nr:exosortase/archaeosortase family protein [Armatimonadota bacterium]